MEDRSKIRNKLRDIFNKYDVIGIGIGKENYDEYDPEINELIRVLDKIRSLSQMQKSLLKIFEKMFWKSIVKEEKIRGLAKDLYDFLKV